MKHIKIEVTIVVPNDKEDLETADGWYHELVNVKRFYLTEKQFEFLLNGNGLMYDLSELSDFFIDYFEAARIELPNLPTALELVKNYKIKATIDMEKEALEIIIESLEYAIKRETFWEIWVDEPGTLDSFIAINYDPNNPVKRKPKKK